jgi:hypothetical protein
LVHRMTWEIHNGPPPNGLDVLHRCDTPLCININHLFLGNHADNMVDKTKKGRAPSKLSVEDVYDIRGRMLVGESMNSISKRYGVAPATIRDIKNGITWKHV